ncbi:hypothetical protein E5676_scaffold506G001280 [Cucumis melo var. makuwa]|uniref:Endonuclease/exonuclease/phosphatase domain-containing protein n=1 Tax=Cucumis melo var. makuwa TaxID=1194695 RepID=A0A5D3BB44_CUCMM|nr:hypothetical protein E5676_scaffold506G001280 [Cucumis melo var. makuwa]
MKSLCWNTRGLGSPSKRAQIKNLISSYDTDLVIVTETKLHISSSFNLRSIWNKAGVKFPSLNSNGYSGGILILRNDINFKVASYKEENHSLSVNILNLDGTSWWISSIYGPSSNKDRVNFWDELKQLQSLSLPNWMLASDFNIVRWRLETNAKKLDKRNMESFNDFIQVNGLIDPPLSNNAYTWSNLRASPTFSQLDRFLYTKNWELIFKPLFSGTLQRTISYHFPIILESQQIAWGPCPFRLNNSSLKEKDFAKNIHEWCNNTIQEGYPGYAFIQKLKHLASLLKNWQAKNLSTHASNRREIL